MNGSIGYILVKNQGIMVLDLQNKIKLNLIS